MLRLPQVTLQRCCGRLCGVPWWSLVISRCSPHLCCGTWLQNHVGIGSGWVKSMVLHREDTMAQKRGFSTFERERGGTWWKKLFKNGMINICIIIIMPILVIKFWNSSLSYVGRIGGGREYGCVWRKTPSSTGLLIEYLVNKVKLHFPRVSDEGQTGLWENA